MEGVKTRGDEAEEYYPGKGTDAAIPAGNKRERYPCVRVIHFALITVKLFA